MQVKSGHISASQVRDLKGVLEREKAELGLFVTLNPPTEPMRQEAISAGVYVPEPFPGTPVNVKYPRLQILTIGGTAIRQRGPLPPLSPPSHLQASAPPPEERGVRRGGLFRG